jgi:2-amino-4-hydroxy-6-hydroxymethyldihydropteridine diphosphokinase
MGDDGVRGVRGEAGAGVWAAVGIGTNLGDRAGMVRFAFDRLGGLGVVREGCVIETEPVGPAGQGRYLNSAGLVRTRLGARELLAGLLEIERAAGRERSASERWGPRELDLDLLLYGDAVIDEPGLCVPHPRMHERRFVLEPLAGVGGWMVHPVLGVRVSALLGRLAPGDGAGV